MIGKLIDSAVSAVAPIHALKRVDARERMRIVNSGYSNHGASRRKKSMVGWNWFGGSHKEDIEDNLKVLRERSRDAYMGIPIATGAIKTMRTNVVGSGLKLKSNIDFETIGISEEEARSIEKKIESEFDLWADSIHCDVQQMNNFYDLQRLAYLSQLMSGEVFATLPNIDSKKEIMPYSTKIQLIEADRVSSPNDRDTENIFSGVEMGKHGEVKAYHISTIHPLSTSTNVKKEWKRIEKIGMNTGLTNVLHLMEAERPEQRRGVPILAPVIDSLKQLGRYSDAELMAAVVSSMFTVFITSGDEDSDEGPQFGDNIPEEDQVSNDANDYELGTGAMIALAPGEKVDVANPGRNNTSFDPFVVSICRQIGTALEIPYEVLLKHFTSSYSASRAALLEAWKSFKASREFLSNHFCQPIFEKWLTEAILLGRINAPGFFNDPIIRKSYTRAEWNGPGQGLLNPLNEVNAAIKRVENGFSTRAKETTELNGGDFYDNVSSRISEEKAMRKGGIDLYVKKEQAVLVDPESSE
ncbi:phage portal protein [Viridibacillus sp. FSL R5-0468]|uniref:phage portal protein n=1 Tax=Viridibacillus sp. FSL R5-0468 TaxID=2921640 RepID=UPI0030F67B8D